MVRGAREHYARNFYRPAGDLQVEWTFPFRSGDFVVDQPMPETTALMAAIDLVRPTVGASLHNGEMGGAYFYASEGATDAYYERLGELCLEHSVPLHLGDPEAPFSAVLAPAVFSIPATQQIFDYIVAAGGDPADMISGGSSIEYMMRHNDVFGIVVELPYWRDDRSADTSPDPSGKTLREVVLHGLDLEEEMVNRLHALYEQASPLEPSPFQEAINSFIMEQGTSFIDVQRHQADNNPEGGRPATVAEVFSIMDNVHMFRLRMGGMFLRGMRQIHQCDANRRRPSRNGARRKPPTAEPTRSRSTIWSRSKQRRSWPPWHVEIRTSASAWIAIGRLTRGDC